MDSEISNESKVAVGPVLYPNPATNTIYIDNLGMVSGLNRYEVFDMSGTMVKKLKLQEPEYITIDISSLSKGVYMLKLLGGDDSFSYKFIKQ